MSDLLASLIPTAYFWLKWQKKTDRKRRTAMEKEQEIEKERKSIEVNHIINIFFPFRFSVDSHKWNDVLLYIAIEIVHGFCDFTRCASIIAIECHMEYFMCCCHTAPSTSTMAHLVSKSRDENIVKFHTLTRHTSKLHLTNFFPQNTWLACIIWILLPPFRAYW